MSKTAIKKLLAGLFITGSLAAGATPAVMTATSAHSNTPYTYFHSLGLQRATYFHS